MRTPAPGQSNWDVAGQALGSGVDTLHLLRERERQRGLETEDRELKKTAAETQITLQKEQIENAREGRKIGATKAQEDARRLDAEIKHWERADAADAVRASAEKTRANTAATGGRTAAQVQMIENLTAQKIAQGVDEVTAKAEATKEVMSTGKARSPGDRYLELIREKAKTWADNLDNLGKAPTADEIKAWRTEAEEEVRNMTRLDAVGKGEPVPETPTSGNIVRSGAGQDPAVLRTVNALRAQGVDPARIAAALQQKGLDPKLYGY